MKRCLFCGQLNPDNALTCDCGSSDLEMIQSEESRPETVSPPSAQTSAKMPAIHSTTHDTINGGIKSYLAQAVLTTIFCCTPLGIVAIVYASKVSAKKESGDHQGALTASREARKWCWISFGLGILLWIVFMIIGSMSDK
jgi:hypothetical protein